MLALTRSRLCPEMNFAPVTFQRHPERSRISGGAKACPELAEGDLASTISSLRFPA